MNIVIQIETYKKDLIRKVKEFLFNDLKVDSIEEKREKQKIYNVNTFEAENAIEVWNIYVDDISKENVNKLEINFGKEIKIIKGLVKTEGIEKGVNVDYHTIMEKSNFNYAEWYENLMRHKEETFVIENELANKLRKKRKFGISKYGDKSFQASFEASMTSPIIEHAKEELIDEINYLFHLHFVFQTEDKPIEEIEILEKNINTIIKLYSYLSTL